MGDITQIPTMTIPTAPASGNKGLGLPLVDARPTTDHTREIAGEAFNYVRQLVTYHQQMIGASVGSETLPPAVSLRGRVTALEEAAPPSDWIDLTDPTVFYFRDWFDEATFDATRWTETGEGKALPALSANWPAAVFDYDTQIGAGWPRYILTTTSKPHLRFLVVMSATPPTGQVLTVRFADDNGYLIAGVLFTPTTNIIAGAVASNGSGSVAYTSLGAWVQDVPVDVHARIDADLHLWVSLDGDSEVDCGAIASAPHFRLEMLGPYASQASGSCSVLGVCVYGKP